MKYFFGFFSKQKLYFFFAVIIPFLVFLYIAHLLNTWIVDDAGISFVYSRNLADGYGLVSQPGVTPVECYSNFSWVALLALFFKIGWFDPLLTPKLVSYGLVLGTFILLAFSLLSFSSRRWVTIPAVLLLLSISTPFVVWTISGLENPLYAFLLTCMMYLMIRVALNPTKQQLNSIVVGALASLVALTRPDGVVYAVAFPIFLLCLCFKNKPFSWQPWIKFLVFYVVSFSLIYGGYLLFRYLYFGSLFPNTYFIKGGPTFQNIKDIILLRQYGFTKLSLLTSSFANRYGNLLFVLLVTALLVLASRREIETFQIPPIILWVLALINFVLLPNDWMYEFRFATPFILFLYPVVLVVFERWSDLIPLKTRLRRWGFIALVLLFLAGSWRVYDQRILTFSKNPTVPLSVIEAQYAHRYDDYAKTLGIEHASILLPDVGATLYYSHLRIYDLAGLCDSTIAKTIGKSQPDFYNYVFDVVKPTFIHMHPPWSRYAKLDQDPRFRENYIPLSEQLDIDANEYFGDYVRKEAVANKEEILNSILAP